MPHLTPDFDLTVRLDALEGRPAPLVSVAGNCALADSEDGTATVAVLGGRGAETLAAHLARTFNRDEACDAWAGSLDVASVIIDRTRKSVTAVSGPIGLRQVFWATHDGAISFASAPRRLGCLGGRAPALRPAALFDYLYFHMIPGPQSAFQGVGKLPGGHRLHWDGSSPTLARYWAPGFESGPRLSEDDAATQLRELLRGSVARSLDSAADAGAFLSGGLDSSTVAGLAAEVRTGLPTVTMGFAAEGYDEMEFARTAVRRFGTRPLEYYVTPEDVLATLPRIAASFHEPFGNSSAAAAYQCARVANEHGLSLLLAGDGGDELFGGNDRYARQLVFERYSRIPAALRSRLVEPMVGAAARLTQAFPVGKAASYVAQANVPLPDRLQAYNFLHRIDPATVFAPELLAQVDREAPLRMLREEYRAPDAHSPIDRMLFLDWKFTLHDNDLVKVNTMCDLAGIEVAYPMLDTALVDFSRRLPADWKVRNGELRWFYKRALQGFLPDEIIRKTKHGFGLPFGVWTRTHTGLRRLCADALASLGERGFFQKPFLDEARRLHEEAHASYYGELVWLLVVLELWLREHCRAR
jgi:asparagine synthase (glutamine-hydrolysing)